MLYKDASVPKYGTATFSPSTVRTAPSPPTMKVAFALAFFAVIGLAYTQDGVCSLPAESREELVECLRARVGELTLAKFRHIKTEVECADIQCVFTKICELSSDTHAQHADFFSAQEKTRLRADFATCRATL
ncbi:uncharacterized protein LOC144147073 isoform X2 [Haemaphysalis longicornis]